MDNMETDTEPQTESHIRVANNTDKLVGLVEQMLEHIECMANSVQSLHHINERLILENVNLRKKVQGAPPPSVTSGDDFSPYGNEPRPPRPIVFGEDGQDGQIRLTGGTFDFKHVIKQHDGRWDSAAKVWTIPTASREAANEALKTAGALI